jgi:hypothetical protein
LGRDNPDHGGDHRDLALLAANCPQMIVNLRFDNAFFWIYHILWAESPQSNAFRTFRMIAKGTQIARKI